MGIVDPLNFTLTVMVDAFEFNPFVPSSTSISPFLVRYEGSSLTLSGHDSGSAYEREFLLAPFFAIKEFLPYYPNFSHQISKYSTFPLKS